MRNQILQLAQGLERARKDEQWETLRQLDSRVNQLLQAIAQSGDRASLKLELDLLRAAHRRALKACNEQLEVLRFKLQQLQQQREGIQAYALFAEDQERAQ